jgi:hypothetical protein
MVSLPTMSSTVTRPTARSSIVMSMAVLLVSARGVRSSRSGLHDTRSRDRDPLDVRLGDLFGSIPSDTKVQWTGGPRPAHAVPRTHEARRTLPRQADSSHGDLTDRWTLVGNADRARRERKKTHWIRTPVAKSSEENGYPRTRGGQDSQGRL